jgi:ribosomal protein S18 acetylase RimI-like enzyme
MPKSDRLSGVEMRALEADDFEPLRQLCEAEFPAIPYSRRSLRSYVENPNFLGVVASKQGAFVGATYGLFFPEDKRVHWLLTVIAASMRGSGLGRALAGEIERKFVEAGAIWCHGECRTDETNPIEFWLRLGFEPCGRADRFYLDYNLPILRLPIWRTELGRQFLERRRLTRWLGLRRLPANFVRKSLPQPS